MYITCYTLPALRSDESGGYIALIRTSDNTARDTDGDDLRILYVNSDE